MRLVPMRPPPSLRTKLIPKRIRKPLIPKTPFPKFQTEVQLLKHKHHLDAQRPPPMDWHPKPEGKAIMPRRWKETGLGYHLCSLSEKELEQWALMALRPVVDSATKEDGSYIVEDNNFMDFMFKRTSLREAILKGAEKAFGTLIPHRHQANIVSVRNLVEWLVQRVEIARPVPVDELPEEVEIFLDAWNKKRVDRELRASIAKYEYQQQTRDPWRDQFDWEYNKSPDASWLEQYVKKEADRILEEKEKERLKKHEEERKAAAKEAMLKALAERKSKALSMRAMLEQKKSEPQANQT